MQQNLSDIEKCLRKYFSTDKDLIEKWHIAAGNGLEPCVQRTLKDLQTNTYDTFTLYEFADDMGFFGIEEGNFLTTFFIHPKNRNKKDVASLWESITNNLTDTFRSALFAKNTPAIEFFLRNNGKVIAEGEYNKEQFVVFEFNRR